MTRTTIREKDGIRIDKVTDEAGHTHWEVWKNGTQINGPFSSEVDADETYNNLVSEGDAERIYNNLIRDNDADLTMPYEEQPEITPSSTPNNPKPTDDLGL